MAQGSVFRKGVGWAFRVDAGYHAGSGKRRQVLKQGFPTKKAAQTALADVVSGNAKGSVVSQSTVRVEVFLREWLVTVRSRLRPTTFYSYEIAVQRISGALGRYQLQSLTPLQIEKFYADELASGGRDGGPLAPKTVRNTHVVLRKALADAERLDLVPRNAASAARPPATSRADMTTWSTDDVRVFFAAVDDHRLKVAFLLLATTGMRRGEVLGLRWSDVDLDGAQLAVANTRTTAGSTVVMGPPKTARSRRHIYLDKQTVSVVREHRRRQREERLAVGSAWHDTDDLVVRDQVGRPIHPDRLSREFDRIVATLDVPRIRLHDLRHTHATLALKAGVHPKVVSERLGHATVGVTLDLYSHVVPSIARDAAEQIVSGIFE